MSFTEDNLFHCHGGHVLHERLLNDNEKEWWFSKIISLPGWQVDNRQRCDIELLLNGGFSPLEGFMTETQYNNTVNHMRIDNNTLWPLPITLSVPKEFIITLGHHQQIVLLDRDNTPLAVMEVESIWKPDKLHEALTVYGTKDYKHPGVDYLINQSHPYYIGGEIFGLSLPRHHDFIHLRLSPKQQRILFKQLGWDNVVAFQTRNPMHRAHYALTLEAATKTKAKLLIHPAVGQTKPGDIDHFTRVRCYQQLLPYYPPNTALLSLLPLAMRMAGPREALLHAIIRQNYGCNHFIVGRDHAGPGNDHHGNPFYPPCAAQELALAYEKELEIKIIPFEEMVYVPKINDYLPTSVVNDSNNAFQISGTELRRRLHQGEDIPSWFSYPEIIKELQKSYPPKHMQGITIFLTGLSGAGKSTIANVLLLKLMELSHRKITLLDGDIIRTNLSSELGFSKEHRDIHVLRVGYLASEITKHGGIAICALIAPYIDARNQVRHLIEPKGGFFEVFVATPFDICEQRDTKGLYQKAREGILKNFTGMDSPYEPPENPEITINTAELNVEECANQILNMLIQTRYLSEISQKTPSLLTVKE